MITYAIKVAEPLVDVLKLVDGEQKAAMGYIYEAMDRAKERIAENFQNKEGMYKKVFEVIDHHWNNQLHHPLHAAGIYLNPVFFFREDFDPRGEIFDDLMDFVKKMYPFLMINWKLWRAWRPNNVKKEDLERNGLKCTEPKKTPARWLKDYGKKVPVLQQFAMRVLNLVCSSSGCERNFSVFEDLHTKKRNKLEQQCLNDLVFIKYNRALNRHFNQRDTMDPIELSYIDEKSEFLTGVLEAENDEVCPGLSWMDVAIARGLISLVVT